MTDEHAPNESGPAPETGDAAPSPAPQVDVRRLLLVIALIVGGLAYFFWDDVRDVVKRPEIVVRTVPPEPETPDDPVELRRRRGALDVTFTRVGAAVKHLTWTGPDGHVETLIAQEVPNRAFLVELPGSEKWAEHLFDVTDIRRETHTDVRFERRSEGGSLVLVKTFRIYEDKPVIDLEVRIRNAPPHDWVRWRPYTFTVCNAAGVPSELGKDDCLISVRANNFIDHHRVRRISGVQDWPSVDEIRRANHGLEHGPVRLEWVATASKYYGVVVRPERPLVGTKRAPATETDPEHPPLMELTRTADCGAAVVLHVSPRKDPNRLVDELVNVFHIYAGPKDYDALAALPGRQQECVDYWYFGRPTILLLEWMQGKVRNYGVAIILLTLLFRALMWPVTSYNLKSMVNIKIANARLADIDAREPPRSDVEGHTWWLKEARVWEKVQSRATIGVFLPMAILLPVLLILYYALKVGHEFHHQPFVLWISDISARDPSFLLPILMGAAMMGQLRTMSEDPSKERSWIVMPVAFTVLFAFFSAGLVLFWLTDTLAGWLQLALIKRRGAKPGSAARSAVERAEQRVAEISAARAAPDSNEDDEAGAAPEGPHS